MWSICESSKNIKIKKKVHHLYQVIPGEEWKSDVLHQFGHILQTGWFVMLDPGYHSFKHLGDTEER